MSPETARSIANGANELLDTLAEFAESRVRATAYKEGLASSMTDAEINARIARELDRLIACAHTVAIDQISIEIDHARPKSGPSWRGD